MSLKIALAKAVERCGWRADVKAVGRQLAARLLLHVAVGASI